MYIIIHTYIIHYNTTHTPIGYGFSSGAGTMLSMDDGTVGRSVVARVYTRSHTCVCPIV